MSRIRKIQSVGLLGLSLLAPASRAEVWIPLEPASDCGHDPLKMDTHLLKVGLSLQGDTVFLQSLESPYGIGVHVPGLLVAERALDRELTLSANELERLAALTEAQVVPEEGASLEVEGRLPEGQRELLEAASRRRLSALNRKVETRAQQISQKVSAYRASRNLLLQLKEGHSDAESGQVLALFRRLSIPLDLEDTNSVLTAACRFSSDR